MPFDQQLRVPGPTPLPEQVIRAQSRPMINHRGPEFGELLRDIVTGLKLAFQTDNDVLLYPASGTGGLEAAVANLLSPGEPALFCTTGSFGERWAEIAQGYGADVFRLAVPWGDAVDPSDVEAILEQNPQITTVFITHNETSTGVTNDVATLAAIAKQRGKFVAVDSVSGAGCIPLETDAWNLDVVVTGSQKGWMAPPGLTMLSVSKAAFEKSASATSPRWYFDFAREKGFQDKDQTATTPPLSVMYALQEGLRLIHQEGLSNVFTRHARIGAMVRAGVDAVGLRLLAPEGARSNTVTAIHSPVEAADRLKELLTLLRVEHGVVLAGGQGELRGKIFRIGHLGAIDDPDVYAVLGALELAMVQLGMLSRVGQCVAAAQAVARPVAAATPVA